MKIITLSLAILFMSSCKKDSGTNCYECKRLSNGTDYMDVGCFEKSQWDSYNPVDVTGNNLDKKNDCRKK